MGILSSIAEMIDDISSILQYIVENIDIIRILIHVDDRYNNRWLCSNPKVIDSVWSRHYFTLSNLHVSRCLCRLFLGSSFNTVLHSKQCNQIDNIKIKCDLPSVILVRLPHPNNVSGITDITLISDGKNSYVITGNDEFRIITIPTNQVRKLLMNINNGDENEYKRLTSIHPIRTVKVIKCISVPLTSAIDVELVNFMVNMISSTIIADINRSHYQLNYIANRLRISIGELIELIHINIYTINSRRI